MVTHWGIHPHLHLREPAWLRQTEGEQRWPVAILVLVAIALQALGPADLAVHPTWLAPLVELCLLVVLIIANPVRISRQVRWLRLVGLALVAVGSAANAFSALVLVRGLLHGGVWNDAGHLMVVGGGIWLTNVVMFALWYWEFDRGGPANRSAGVRRRPDFQFPQMVSETHAQEWEPTVIDYLYLSFTNAMAFSPTDTMPMSRWAKMLMLAQAMVSLVVVALVIARGVNILR
jgi:uncharacterized membrane protein